MSRIVVFTTGGTIAMKPAADGRGVVPALSGADLVAVAPGIEEFGEIDVREFSNISSSMMTPEKMLDLAHVVGKTLAEDDVAGVVITHGTDTMEESAYLLDLVIDSPKPVVFTGAMRSAGELSSDGPKNILCSVKAAASPLTRDLGVLVCMNEELHAAGQVTKTHSSNVAAFASPWHGPVGYVDEDRVFVTARPVDRQHISPKALKGDVGLVKVSAGCGGYLVRALVDSGVAGIVVEGFGRGNVPPDTQTAMIEAVKAGIPVVLTSRCGAGRPYYAYGSPGCGKISKENGIIISKEISGQKARIKLLLALGLTDDMEKIKEFFE